MINNSYYSIKHQKGLIEIDIMKINHWINIEIKDNGNGMSHDVLRKIGTPFFTTKKDGNGVGLSVCYNIIESHGGRIEVDSEVGKGTTFFLILPPATYLKSDETEI